jgi:uncharacterized peroxidase-related enzyme
MSSYLTYRSPGDMGDDWRAMLERTEQALGYVPNYTKLFAHRPEAFAAWRNLIGVVAGAMDERRYELATVAAARRLRSSYCSLAHGKILAEKFHTPDQVVGIYTGDAQEVIDETDRAVMALADKVAKDATSVTEEDIENLRSLGLSDTDVFDVILAAAVRCFFSKVLDASGTLPDIVYSNLDPALQEAMTVGRPVEST